MSKFEDLLQELIDDATEEEFQRRLDELEQCQTLEQILDHLIKYRAIEDISNGQFSAADLPGPNDTIH